MVFYFISFCTNFNSNVILLISCFILFKSLSMLFRLLLLISMIISIIIIIAVVYMLKDAGH